MPPPNRMLLHHVHELSIRTMRQKSSFIDELSEIDVLTNVSVTV